MISTHNLDEVERVADRVAVLRSRLVALDTPDALRSRLFGRRVSITLAEPAAKYEPVVRSAGTHDVTIDDRTMTIALEGDAVVAPSLVKALVDAGARIVSVIPEERSLEEVYLRLLKDVEQ